MILERLASAVLSAVDGEHTVLDMGCGTGLVARQLSRRGIRVIAVDPSGAMIERCRRRSAAHDYIVSASPPDHLEWDAAALVNVLHICEAPERLLREVVRRTPGCVIVNWPRDTVTFADLARWERAGGAGLVSVARSALLRVVVGVPGAILQIRGRPAETVREIVERVAVDYGRSASFSEIPATGCVMAVITPIR